MSIARIKTLESLASKELCYIFILMEAYVNNMLATQDLIGITDYMLFSLRSMESNPELLKTVN